MGTLRWRRGRRGRRGRQRRRRWWRPVLRMGRLHRLEGQHCRPARVPAAVSPLRQAPRTPTVRCGRRLEPTHLSHGALAGAAGADALSPAAAASLSNRLARSDAVEVRGPGLRPVLVDGVGNGGAGGKDGLKGCSHVVRNNRVVRNRARTVREAPQAATAEPANLAEHLGACIGVGWGWGWVGVAGAVAVAPCVHWRRAPVPQQTRPVDRFPQACGSARCNAPADARSPGAAAAAPAGH